jgi:hypothetical protein
MCQPRKFRAVPPREATALRTVNGVLHDLFFNDYWRVVINEIE